MSPFEPTIYRKLFMYNMAHSVISYLGFLVGKKYLCDALANPSIRFVSYCALSESARALSREHSISLDKLLAYADELLLRFENPPLGITVARTGMDPVRKLSRGDRLIGAAMICRKWGVAPVYISLGAAAAFLFNPPDDPTAKEVATLVRSAGIHETISSVCGLDEADPVLNLMAFYYNLFITGKSLDGMISLARIPEKLSDQLGIPFHVKFD